MTYVLVYVVKEQKDTRSCIAPRDHLLKRFNFKEEFNSEIM